MKSILTLTISLLIPYLSFGQRDTDSVLIPVKWFKAATVELQQKDDLVIYNQILLEKLGIQDSLIFIKESIITKQKEKIDFDVVKLSYKDSVINGVHNQMLITEKTFKKKLKKEKTKNIIKIILTGIGALGAGYLTASIIK